MLCLLTYTLFKSKFYLFNTKKKKKNLLYHSLKLSPSPSCEIPWFLSVSYSVRFLALSS